MPLTNFNGRNAFQDAREEVVDLHQYLTQAEAEFTSIARTLYVYAMTEGFFNQLQPHIQAKLLEVVEGKFLAEICLEEGITFNAPNKQVGPKSYKASSEPWQPLLQERRYSNISGADNPHND